MRIPRFLRQPSSAIGVVLLAMFAAVAVAAPWLAPPERPCPSFVYYVVPDWLTRPIWGAPPCEPYRMPRDGFRATPLPPDWSAWRSFPPDVARHPLGTTENRYDIWYGLVWGTRTALSLGIIIVGCTLFIGLVVGVTSGYFGGWVDGTLMRVCDFMFAMPTFLATLVLISVLGRGLDKIVLSSIAFGWAGYARFIRGDVLAVRDRGYVDAARAIGAGPVRIMARHVVPNMIYPVLILASLNIGTIVLGLAGLSFLGLGSGENYADWGAMIALARNRIVGSAGGDLFMYWYTAFFPGVTIFLFVLAWNLVGTAARDQLDPHLRHRSRG